MSGEWKIGPLMAYQGDPDCTSMLCRRYFGADNRITPGCIGWHCAVCCEPSSQYGHSECAEQEGSRE